jgi:hypothetical protein
MSHASEHGILTPAQVLDRQPFLGAQGARWAAIAFFTGLGLVLISIGAGVVAGDGLKRFLFSYLQNYVYFVSLGLGALFFVMLQHLTRASWSVVVRRLAELIAGSLPFMGLLALPILVPLLLGNDSLYAWLDPALRASDPLIAHKAGYLNLGFFIVRLAFYFGVWSWLSQTFLSKSTQQDASGDPKISLRLWRLSAPGIALFALTATFFAFDMVMSLDPRWFSTIFGVYFFAGSLIGFFGILVLCSVLLQAGGRLRQVITAEHYHDLGKLLFAFVFFWGYIAFSQFMLIWYANIPEETAWYLKRQTGDWVGFSVFLLLFHLLIPFAILISRLLKRRKRALVIMAVWLIIAHWIDIYYLVMPEYAPGGGHVPWHLLDFTCLAGVGCLFASIILHRAASRSLVPLKDPLLADSLRFENV